jgi:circadian clock protein KaiB
MSGRKVQPQDSPWDETVRVAGRQSTMTDDAKGDFWEFRLYVAGKTPRGEAAVANLTRVCELRLRGHYSIAVIDLLANPRLASADQIVALPTLVRRLPVPIKKIIGDLSNFERMLVGLELKTYPVQP